MNNAENSSDFAFLVKTRSPNRSLDGHSPFLGSVLDGLSLSLLLLVVLMSPLLPHTPVLGFSCWHSPFLGSILDGLFLLLLLLVVLISLLLLLLPLLLVLCAHR